MTPLGKCPHIVPIFPQLRSLATALPPHTIASCQNPSFRGKTHAAGWMVATLGTHKGEDFRIFAGENIIGAAAACDVVLSDHGISRHHARLTVSPDDVFLEDLDSRYGMQVNGLPVNQEHLVDGDEIAFGGGVTRFLFRTSTCFEPGYVPNFRPRPPAPQVYSTTALRAVYGWLVAASGPHEGLDWHLLAGQNQIGTRPGISIVLPRTEIDDIHAVIECTHEHFSLRRVSTKTLKLNGNELSAPATLRDSDIIEIGNARYWLKCLA